MNLGAVFPQTEIGHDAGAVREYAQAAEELGYSYILAYDHVIGANPASRPGWQGVYDVDSSFFEPFSLFSYIAGFTQKIRLVTGIIILPQRQTVLVAKQAATLDILSGGRLKLGIGIGWNDVEYEALGENFHDRGKRSEEQIELLRQLWTSRSVTFKGKWHTVTDAGISPLPAQRPIPIWLGGGAEPVIRRVARMADGWMPQLQPDEEGRRIVDRMRMYATEYGRDPSEIDIQGAVRASLGTRSDWAELVARWRQFGADDLSVNTMGDGLTGPADHIQRLTEFKDAADSA